MQNKAKNIGVFVDVQNVYYTCRQAYQKQFNYRQLWQQLSEHGNIIVANAYAIARQDDQQIKFQDALRHIGFEVKLKPFIQRSDGTAKGDWDVGITVDMIDQSAHLDEVILLSGDGDFAVLMGYIKTKFGVSTQVYSVPKLTAKTLSDCVDVYHSIEANSPLLK
ncbi:NYN domain-containing protein [Aliiglaciecola sp. 2_MG-2023]|uniref:LabA-like NYN domain-containing protein n=1 Tax=unclassified Aliiglaciecola TaxID=2593648 RepID=UPI0026E290B9|nr:MULTISPECIES: NYN domain-containing protein [unclassified Aliiglaciecola]MDO6711637.1 NYN domain-containing protein [Aliiglaciecola sp. 2_MG-2023]MDO6752708.1 NYN domain-containing protein [Aliiglaciecola sp. 1_MG-2023]